MSIRRISPRQQAAIGPCVHDGCLCLWGFSLSSVILFALDKLYPNPPSYIVISHCPDYNQTVVPIAANVPPQLWSSFWTWVLLLATFAFLVTSIWIILQCCCCFDDNDSSLPTIAQSGSSKTMPNQPGKNANSTRSFSTTDTRSTQRTSTTGHESIQSKQQGKGPTTKDVSKTAGSKGGKTSRKTKDSRTGAKASNCPPPK